MKKFLFTLIIGLGLAGLTNATLWDYYNGDLPRVSDRVSEAIECGINDYTGTYDQNIKLEDCLRSNNFLGASTSTVTTPNPRLYSNQTWTGINTYTSSTISSGNNTFSGINSFSSTTNLSTTTVGGVNIDPLLFGTSTALHFHNSNSGVFASTSLNFAGGGYPLWTISHGLGNIPKKIKLKIIVDGDITTSGEDTSCSSEGYWNNYYNNNSTSTQNSIGYWFNADSITDGITLLNDTAKITECYINNTGLDLVLWDINSTNIYFKVTDSASSDSYYQTFVANWEAEL